MDRPVVVSPRSRRIAVAAVLAVVALIILGGAATFYTDLLWFRETRFTSVFWTEIRTKASLGTAFGAIFGVLLGANLLIAQKITSPRRFFTVSDQMLERYRATLQPYVRWIVLGAAALFGLFAGSGATGQWKSWLLFRHGGEFGRTDPVFGKDLGFYVFRLPFHRFLFTWGFSTLLIITLVVAGAHYLLGGIRAAPRGPRIAPEVRAHLSVLLGAMVLLKAWGYRLDQMSLLYSPRGTVTGASYTDVNAQLPALKLLVIIALLVGVMFLVNAWIRAWVLPLAGIGLLFVTSILAGGIYPAFVQRVRVAPVERTREAPYIERNIEATRASFDIDKDRVTVKGFPARTALDKRTIDRNRETVDNIRLWEPTVLADVYVQLQQIRQYYQFGDVDVDRYSVDGRRIQVMLSAREMVQSDLQEAAKTWVNTRLIYTHGFGVVASRVNRVGKEGQPDFLLKNIPPQAAGSGLEVTQPRVYFGEKEETPYVVVRSQEKELDYPAGETFEGTTYSGTGGVPLKDFFRRAAFAWRFRDVNLVLSGALRSDSRIMFRRNVGDRVRRVAPFLKFDGDPYIAIVGGRLVWIVDAYTTSDMYPYAQRVDLGDITGGMLLGSANYIRNSVKATVDAENGTVTLYLWDESDPVIRAWGSIFPGILTPRSEMPPELLEHVRYPEDLFKVQTDRYALYHMTDPEDFYLKEDAWEVPADPTAPASNPRMLPPYYVLMKLPGERAAEFVLMRPFTPNNRQNMIAWMAARSDPADYGRLMSFTFPKQSVVPGPGQVEARMNQDPAVSTDRTFFDQAKSEVILGNLLVIPIEDSLLYVQPWYLSGQGSRLPELKRVIVLAGDKVKIGQTLEEALGLLLGTAPEVPTETAPPPGATIASLVREALERYAAAQAALRRGDLAGFQRELERMKQALDRAAEAGPSATPSPTPQSSPPPRA
ncbi:MAG: UPF0182 family protein [Acidobacteria bacterium]|nr:UPF0182 family protein [Acidobacteriota bacterium]